MNQESVNKMCKKESCKKLLNLNVGLIMKFTHMLMNKIQTIHGVKIHAYLELKMNSHKK